MAYFNVCENCGAHLDPGEVCDCIKKPAEGTNQGGQAVNQSNGSTTNSNIHFYYTKNAPKSQGGNENKNKNYIRG